MTKEDLMIVTAALDEARFRTQEQILTPLEIVLTEAILICRRELQITEQDRADAIRETSMKS